VTIIASSVPFRPDPPATTAVSNTAVTITWTAPNSGGSPISSYTIKIRHSDNVTYSDQTSNCDGSNPAIFSALSCTIPISVLQAAPFNLDWGYDIYATVSASNVIGTSLTSVEGNGAKITTNPD
jgi:hypothetical protein